MVDNKVRIKQKTAKAGIKFGDILGNNNGLYPSHQSMLSSAQHSIIVRAEGFDACNSFEWEIAIKVNSFWCQSHVSSNVIDLVN